MPSLLPIVQLPSRALRIRTQEIPATQIANPKMRTLIGAMKHTLASAKDGVGLAAPQVGRPLRLFLVSEEAKAIDTASARIADGKELHPKWGQFVFINPVLLRHSRKKIELTEGCLSVKEKFGIVPRYEKVELEWLDEDGKKHRRGFTGFFARVIQHELDHLDGMLIADRARELFLLNEDS